MPSTVRVTCLLCEHPVEVAARDVVLHLARPESGTGHRYGFSCPSCEVYVVRPASEAVLDLLLAANVRLATDDVPPWEQAERPGIVLVDAGPHVEGIADPDAPPLTEADALLLRAALEDDRVLAAWLAA